MEYEINDHRIPVQRGHAVLRGWPKPARRPLSVTWHVVTVPAHGGLRHCRMAYGGNLPTNRGRASYHYAIGPSLAEGVDLYVELTNRAIAPTGQTLAWDGLPCRRRQDSATETSVHVAVVVPGIDPDKVDNRRAVIVADPQGKQWQVPAWSSEQIAMATEVGREVVARWPGILPRHHLAWADLAPQGCHYPSHAMPLGKIVQGIYAADGVPQIPDVRGSMRTVPDRLQALRRLGYYNGSTQQWGANATAALRELQRDARLDVNGLWTVHVSLAVWSLTHDRWRRSGGRR